MNRKEFTYYRSYFKYATHPHGVVFENTENFETQQQGEEWVHLKLLNMKELGIDLNKPGIDFKTNKITISYVAKGEK